MPQTERDKQVEPLSDGIDALVATRKLIAEGKQLEWCQLNVALKATCDSASLIITLRSQLEPQNGKGAIHT